MLSAITQLSTPPCLMKFMARHEWTKLNILKNPSKNSKDVSTRSNKDSKLITKQSLNLRESIAEKGKPFHDGKSIKNCLTIFTKYACLEKKHSVEQTSLPCFTVSRRTNDLSYDINKTPKERLKSCAAFNMAFDKAQT